MDISAIIGYLCILFVIGYVIVIFMAVRSNKALKRSFQGYEDSVVPKWDPALMNKDRYKVINVKYKL